MGDTLSIAEARLAEEIERQRKKRADFLQRLDWLQAGGDPKTVMGLLVLALKEFYS